MADDWCRYYDASGDEPRGTLLDAIGRFGDDAGFAVDLGAGAGRDAVALLRAGWRVLAIDPSASGIERLREAAAFAAERLETEVAPMEEATWPPAQLVNASFALPFCARESFPSVWRRIVDSLPPGGRFSGQLFGDRDEWSQLTVFTRPEVERLFRPFVLESLSEIEEDGTTALGERKHWHVFHVVARKR